MAHLVQLANDPGFPWLHLGLKSGVSARIKDVPPAILRSPKRAVAAFLRAYFDCDGYAGKQGVILSTASASLGRVVQLLLMKLGILSRRRPHKDGCWHVHKSPANRPQRFATEIGFGLYGKQQNLETYVNDRRWFLEESWDDQIVSIERSRADVYDVSVEKTHRYAAGGLINHNSYWHSTLMSKHFVTAAEIIDYADHHSGTVHMPPGGFNPYKIGIELFRDIEDRWNKGKFGKEYEEAENLGEKQPLGQRRRPWPGEDFRGSQGLQRREFHRRVHDAGIHRAAQVLPIRPRPAHGPTAHRVARSGALKQTLLYQLTNMGRPFIYAVDGNYCNRGELYLAHKHNGLDIEIKYATETLKNVYRIWQRPVHLQARIDDDMILFSYAGDQA